MTEKKRTEVFLASVSYAGEMKAKETVALADRETAEFLAAVEADAREKAEKRAELEISRALSREASRLAAAEGEARSREAENVFRAADGIIRRAAEKLAAFKKSGEYGGYLVESAREIAARLDGESDPAILLCPEDERFVPAVAAAVSVPVRTDPSVRLGGVAGDSRGVRIDASFASALEEERAGVIAVLEGVEK